MQRIFNIWKSLCVKHHINKLKDKNCMINSIYTEKAVNKTHFMISPESRHRWNISSVQFSRSVVPNSLRPHESQHARPPCPSPTPGVHTDSRPSSQWCHPAISSSVVPFSSCPQSLPSSGSFPMSPTLRMRWPNYWSFSFSIIPSKEIPGLISFRMDWSDLLAAQGTLKSLPDTTVQKHQFFGAQLSSQSNSHIHTWLLEKQWPWLDGPLLAN